MKRLKMEKVLLRVFKIKCQIKALQEEIIILRIQTNHTLNMAKNKIVEEQKSKSKDRPIILKALNLLKMTSMVLKKYQLKITKRVY